MSSHGSVVLLLTSLFLPFEALLAQEGPRGESSIGDTVWATPRNRFPAPALQRFILGTGHRELWATPFPVQLLDLDTFAGGLSPLQRGGGLQTLSLRLRGEDGRIYTFRSLDKDASKGLDPLLRASLAAKVLQDLTSALLPLSAMIVDPLLEAAGVLHASPELVLMPDDPHLGEFREDFAGLVGWIEERPDEGPEGEEGFAGAERVTGSERFLELLEEDPAARIDARSFLRARLLDALVGDWDRHPDQWRWAGFREGDTLRFEPIPRDRDWAMSRLDGAIMWATRGPWPHYLGFDKDFPSSFRMTWSGRALDRRILPSLSWSEWSALASELTTRLTDEVLQNAVERLPESHYRQVGPEILEALTNRRDDLLRFTREYYLLLAGWVDVHGTDAAEVAVVDRLPEDRVRVRVFALTEDGAMTSPYFDRTFSSEETKEVRVLLEGGDDLARIQGSYASKIVIRVDGGGGDDTLEVAEGAPGEGVFFFDDAGANTFSPGPGTKVDRRRYEDPVDASEQTHQVGTRDWGSRLLVYPAVTFDMDRGLQLGAQLTRSGYGFRHYPRENRVTLVLGYATIAQRPHAEVSLEFPLVGRRFQGRVLGLATGAQVDKFYGQGNETLADRPESEFESFRSEYALEVGALLRPLKGMEISAGLGIRRYHHDRLEGTLLSEQKPYGFREFDLLSVRTTVTWDGRDRAAWPRRGWALELEARLAPRVADVEEPFGSLQGVASTYFSAGGWPGRPTLALRAGGGRLWGATFPYQEGLFLGGAASLRGFPRDRFTGNSSAFLNGELRFKLGELPVTLLPGDWGLFTLGDVGRVWMEGESSNRWHTALGGGAWAGIIDTFTFALTGAHSQEGTRIYWSGGFHF